MRQLDDFLIHHERLLMLCQFKARPPVIRDLVPDSVPENFIYTMYRKVNGAPPPQGQLPQEIRTFLTSPRRRFQGTVAICAFERYGTIVEDHALRYMYSYATYKKLCKDDLIYDFNRIWFLFRQYQLGRICLARCPHCSCQFIFNREDVSDRRKCCTCAIIKTASDAASRQQLSTRTKTKPSSVVKLNTAQIATPAREVHQSTYLTVARELAA